MLRRLGRHNVVEQRTLELAFTEPLCCARCSLYLVLEGIFQMKICRFNITEARHINRFTLPHASLAPGNHAVRLQYQATCTPQATASVYHQAGQLLVVEQQVRPGFRIHLRTHIYILRLPRQPATQAETANRCRPQHRCSVICQGVDTSWGSGAPYSNPINRQQVFTDLNKLQPSVQMHKHRSPAPLPNFLRQAQIQNIYTRDKCQNSTAALSPFIATEGPDTEIRNAYISPPEELKCGTRGAGMI